MSLLLNGIWDQRMKGGKRIRIAPHSNSGHWVYPATHSRRGDVISVSKQIIKCILTLQNQVHIKKIYWGPSEIWQPLRGFSGMPEINFSFQGFFNQKYAESGVTYDQGWYLIQILLKLWMCVRTRLTTITFHTIRYRNKNDFSNKKPMFIVFHCQLSISINLEKNG